MVTWNDITVIIYIYKGDPPTAVAMVTPVVVRIVQCSLKCSLELSQLRQVITK